MNVMFSKWKNKNANNTNVESGGIGGLEKDGDGSDHPRSYRTHLIFAGKRDPDGGVAPNIVSHSGSHYYTSHSTALSFSSHSNHPFAQAQPPIAQSAPIPINFGYTNSSRTEQSRRKSTRIELEYDPFRNINRQVSFGNSGNNYKLQKHGKGPLESPSSNFLPNADELCGRPGMLDVVAGLSRDCFIIPLNCLERFLPAGLDLPSPESPTSKMQRCKSNSLGPSLNVLEVADPQLAVVVHLMTPFIPLNPTVNELPIPNPERIQKALAMELLQKAALERRAVHGLLLSSMETTSDFPFMTLYVVPRLRSDANDFVDSSRKSALEIFDPGKLGYCGDHFFHLCREVATIARPPSEHSGRKEGGYPATGYIISIFRVFEGDDREKLERNWLYWTGARTLYRHLPQSVGLRRITLHKSAPLRGDKLYLLLCECENFLQNVNLAAQLLPALRARLCGYTGIYRVVSAF